MCVTVQLQFLKTVHMPVMTIIVLNLDVDGGLHALLMIGVI